MSKAKPCMLVCKGAIEQRGDLGKPSRGAAGGSERVCSVASGQHPLPAVHANDSRPYATRGDGATQALPRVELLQRPL